jgi:hypothetical protein
MIMCKVRDVVQAVDLPQLEQVFFFSFATLEPRVE